MITKIVLFDGECTFCDRSVQFIIQRDPDGVFSFASLQSEIAKELVATHQLDQHIDSIVFIDRAQAYIKSDAALRIARELKGLWKLSAVFFLAPRPIRDVVYDFIARNRYKWFGKKEACDIPSPEVRKRFLT